MFNSFVNVIKNLIRFVTDWAKKIIQGVLSFQKHILSFFKELNLKKGQQLPFISKADEFSDKIKNAPVKNCGIFEGVYDLQNDSIIALQELRADSVDDDTRKLLGNDELIVLN